MKRFFRRLPAPGPARGWRTPPPLKAPWAKALDRGLWAALALLLAMHVVVMPVFAEGEGVLDGRLVNGTAGSGAPAGARVTLFAIRDRAKTAEYSQDVDAQGSFHFKALDIDPALTYLLVAEYQNVTYPYLQLIRLSDEARPSVEVLVYEATHDSAAIAFNRANMLLTSVEDGSATVVEMSVIDNLGDRTFVGSGTQDALRIDLPDGATDVTAQVGVSDEAIHDIGDGIAILQPVPPGRHELALSYIIPLSGSMLDLSKQLDYPVGSFGLYLPDTGLQASSPQLTLEAEAPIEMGGIPFRVYSGQNLPAGTQLDVRVSGLPSAGGTRSSPPAWLPPLNTALIVLSGGFLLLGYAFIRRKQVAHHRRSMLAATAFAALFLVVYVARALLFETRLFAGEGLVRTIYLVILGSHTILATALVPLALLTLYRALRGDFGRHRRLARFTFPTWLYVAASGWTIYWMLYQW